MPTPNPNPLDTLRSLLTTHDWADVADRVVPTARTGLHVSKQYVEETVQRRPLFGLIPRSPLLIHNPQHATPGASKIGGEPDLPAGFEWPTSEGRAFTFLAQFRCESLPVGAIDSDLPRFGMLYFFVDGQHFAGRVFHLPEASGLRPALPPSKPAWKGLPDFPVAFLPIPTFPDLASQEFDALHLDEEQVEAFASALARWNQIVRSSRDGETGLHQIGGFPASIQVDVRVAFKAAHERLWGRASDDLSEWHLLFQLDTDADLGPPGRSPRMYFGIRKSDLADERFDRTVFVFQSS